MNISLGEKIFQNENKTPPSCSVGGCTQESEWV